MQLNGVPVTNASIETAWNTAVPGVPLEAASILPVRLLINNQTPAGTVTGVIPSGSVVNVDGVFAQLTHDLEFAPGRPRWMGDNPVGYIIPSRILGTILILPLEDYRGPSDGYVGAVEVINASFDKLGDTPLAPGEPGDVKPVFEPSYREVMTLSGDFRRLNYRRYNSVSASDPIIAEGVGEEKETGNPGVRNDRSWQEKWAPVEVRFSLDGFTDTTLLSLDVEVPSTPIGGIRLVSVPEPESPGVGFPIWAQLENQVTGQAVSERRDSEGNSIVINQISAQWRVRESPNKIVVGSLLFDRDGRIWKITGVDRNPNDRESIINAERTA